jgi:hypothetical protein
MKKTASFCFLMLSSFIAFGVSYESKNGYSLEASELCEASSIDVFNFLNVQSIGKLCNVNVLTQHLNKDMDLEGYVALSKSQYDMQGATFEVSDEVVSGMPAKRIEVSLGVFKFLHIGVLKDSKMYLLTYTASTELFDKNLSEVEKMIKSWKFNN